MVEAPKTQTTRRCRICGQKHTPLFHRYAKRNLYQHIDKMERMGIEALKRYLRWFYSKGLTVADLIVLRRLGVTP